MVGSAVHLPAPFTFFSGGYQHCKAKRQIRVCHYADAGLVCHGQQATVVTSWLVAAHILEVKDSRKRLWSDHQLSPFTEDLNVTAFLFGGTAV